MRSLFVTFNFVVLYVLLDVIINIQFADGTQQINLFDGFDNYDDVAEMIDFVNQGEKTLVGKITTEDGKIYYDFEQDGIVDCVCFPEDSIKSEYISDLDSSIIPFVDLSVVGPRKFYKIKPIVVYLSFGIGNDQVQVEGIRINRLSYFGLFLQKKFDEELLKIKFAFNETPTINSRCFLFLILFFSF